MFSAKSILCSATALYCLNVAVLNTNTAAFVQSELNAAPAPGELLPTRQPKPVNKGAIFFAGFLCVVAWWLGMCGAAALWFDRKIPNAAVRRSNALAVAGVTIAWTLASATYSFNSFRDLQQAEKYEDYVPPAAGGGGSSNSGGAAADPTGNASNVHAALGSAWQFAGAACLLAAALQRRGDNQGSDAHPGMASFFAGVGMMVAARATDTLGVGLLYLSPGQGDIGAQATLGSVAIYELRAIESVRNNPNISPFDELAAIENIQKEFAGLKSTPGLGNLTRQDGQGIAAVSMVVNLVAFATMVFAAKQRYQASGSHSRLQGAGVPALMLAFSSLAAQVFVLDAFALWEYSQDPNDPGSCTQNAQCLATRSMAATAVAGTCALLGAIVCLAGAGAVLRARRTPLALWQTAVAVTLMLNNAISSFADARVSQISKDADPSLLDELAVFRNALSAAAAFAFLGWAAAFAAVTFTWWTKHVDVDEGGRGSELNASTPASDTPAADLERGVPYATPTTNPANQ